MGDPKWEKCLPTSFTELVTIKLSGYMLDKLVQAKLLTLEERSQVDGVAPEEQKVRSMIDLVRKKEAPSFDIFCTILEQSGYSQLANELRSGGTGTGKGSQPPGRSPPSERKRKASAQPMTSPDTVVPHTKKPRLQPTPPEKKPGASQASSRPKPKSTKKEGNQQGKKPPAEKGKSPAQKPKAGAKQTPKTGAKQTPKAGAKTQAHGQSKPKKAPQQNAATKGNGKNVHGTASSGHGISGSKGQKKSGSSKKN